MPHYTRPLKKCDKAGKLRKASNGHASQAKTLTKIMKDQKKGLQESCQEKKEILKLAQVKNQKVAAEDCTRMKTLKTQLASSLPPQQMQEQQLQKLKRSINHMRERYRYLQSVSKELK